MRNRHRHHRDDRQGGERPGPHDVPPCVSPGVPGLAGGEVARAPVHRRPAQPAEADQQRHQRDVGELEPAVEAVDVLAQRPLHLAQLAPDRQHVAAELLDRLPVASLRIRLPPSPVLLELGQLVLHLLQLGRQRLLLLAVAALGLAAQVVDELERAVLGAAAAQRDQRIRARQVVERVDDESRIAGVGDRPPAGRGNRARRPRTGRTADRCRR